MLQHIPESRVGPIANSDGRGWFSWWLVALILHSGGLAVAVIDHDAGRSSPPGPRSRHLAYLNTGVHIRQSSGTYIYNYKVYLLLFSCLLFRDSCGTCYM